MRYFVKQQLKRISLIAYLVSVFKAGLLKHQNKQLIRKYAKRAKKYDIQHTPKKALELFAERTGIRRPKNKLRIFVFGADQSQDEAGFLQALRRLGEVQCFFNDAGEYGPIFSIEPMNPAVRKRNGESLVRQFDDFRKNGHVDLLIGQMWANLLPVEVLAYIRSCKTIVINVAMDDRAVPSQWKSFAGILSGAIGLAEQTDLVLNTSPECCIRYMVHDCPCLYWPLASDPELFRADTKKDLDVVFVGSKYGIRQEVVDAVREVGVKGFVVYGHGWPNGAIGAPKVAELFSRAKIILGVGTCGYTRDVYTMKLRDFDAPMAGALYLTHRNPDLYPFFCEGEEIFYYETAQEAAAKIKTFLADPSFLSSKGAAAALKSRIQHTWDIRLNELFRQIKLLY